MSLFAYLNEQLKTGTWQDRKIACERLAVLGNAEAIHPLIYALDDKDVGVREAAFNALAKLNHPLAVQPIIDHLALEQEETVRLAAVASLGKLRNPKAVEPLSDLLQDRGTAVRLAATQALGEIRDVRALDGLISGLKDASLYVRAASCESLGMLKKAMAVRPLIMMLSDVEPLVREKALEALRRLGEYHLVVAYSQALFGPRLNTTTLQSLARQGDVRLVSALITRLENQYTDSDQKARLSEVLNDIYGASTFPLNKLFCTAHLTRFTRQERDIDDVGQIPFVGCRICGTTYQVIYAARVVAVVDENMTSRWRISGNTLRVNWIQQQELFDFDHVEIATPDDKAVTQLCVRLSNDTDVNRPTRCRDMICDVLPAASINENTFRVLQRTFQNVRKFENGRPAMKGKIVERIESEREERGD